MKVRPINKLHGDWDKLDVGHYAYRTPHGTYFATALRRTEWRLKFQSEATNAQRIVRNANREDGMFIDLVGCKDAARIDNMVPSKDQA